MQALYPLLIGTKEREASRLPDFQMWGCHQQLDGRNLGSKCSHFLFAGPVHSQRLQGRGVQGERGTSIRLDSGHCLGRGWAQLALRLALADAGAWAPLFKSLLQQHHPAMGSGGVQLPPAGQKFSGTEAGASGRVQLHAVFLHGSEDGREHFCLLGWVGCFFFFSFLPFLMAALSAICCTKLACHFKSGLLVLLAWLSRRVSWWFVKSQSHRMGKVARDHTESSDPASLHHTDLHQGVCPYLL